MAAGVLLGSLELDPRQVAVDVVWTGPDSHSQTARLTSAVIVDLIGSATSRVLLVGYAVHTQQSVADALARAHHERDVDITLVIERMVDNPKFSAHGPAFSGLPARRLCWPGARRPEGASLHAKILVIDDQAALIGSANITGAALEKNLECGLLIRGGPVPADIAAHVDGLAARGHLQPVV